MDRNKVDVVYAACSLLKKPIAITAAVFCVLGDRPRPLAPVGKGCRRCKRRGSGRAENGVLHGPAVRHCQQARGVEGHHMEHEGMLGDETIEEHIYSGTYEKKKAIIGSSRGAGAILVLSRCVFVSSGTLKVVQSRTDQEFFCISSIV